MKATRSKDGAMRFTLRTPRRVGGEEIVDGLCWKVTRHGWYSGDKDTASAAAEALKPLWSRKAALKATAEAIAEAGATFWTWAEDNCDPDEADTIRAEARKLVAAKFPELSVVKEAE